MIGCVQMMLTSLKRRCEMLLSVVMQLKWNNGDRVHLLEMVCRCRCLDSYTLNTTKQNFQQLVFPALSCIRQSFLCPIWIYCVKISQWTFNWTLYIHLLAHWQATSSLGLNPWPGPGTLLRFKPRGEVAQPPARPSERRSDGHAGGFVAIYYFLST